MAQSGSCMPIRPTIRCSHWKQPLCNNIKRTWVLPTSYEVDTQGGGGNTYWHYPSQACDDTWVAEARANVDNGGCCIGTWSFDNITTGKIYFDAEVLWAPTNLRLRAKVSGAWVTLLSYGAVSTLSSCYSFARGALTELEVYVCYNGAGVGDDEEEALFIAMILADAGGCPEVQFLLA